MWVGGEGHLCPGPDVVRGSVHLVREADAAPRELVADRRVMSRRSPERAHARIPEHSRQVREIDAILHVAEQDRPAVEEETHGTGLSKGRAGLAGPAPPTTQPLTLNVTPSYLNFP